MSVESTISNPEPDNNVVLTLYLREPPQLSVTHFKSTKGISLNITKKKYHIIKYHGCDKQIRDNYVHEMYLWWMQISRIIAPQFWIRVFFLLWNVHQSITFQADGINKFTKLKVNLVCPVNSQGNLSRFKFTDRDCTRFDMNAYMYVWSWFSIETHNFSFNLAKICYSLIETCFLSIWPKSKGGTKIEKNLFSSWKNVAWDIVL